MQVSKETIKAFEEDNVTKHLRVVFPELLYTVPTGDIYKESLSIKESVCDSEFLQFVGCISSQLKIKIHLLLWEVKGKRIQVWIKAGNTEEIKLFDGIVDSVKMDSSKLSKEITAYDMTYKLSNIDIAELYQGFHFPLTLKDIRDQIFLYLKMDQVETTLPNDDLIINKQYEPTTLSALDVLKTICQINGVWGKMNRDGLFEYISPPELGDSMVPIQVPFQLSTRGAGEYGYTEEVAYYRSLSYEEYQVKLVEKLTIRQDSDDAGVTVGEGENEFVIQGNMWTLGLDTDTLTTVAENIYPKIKGIMYHPYKCTCNGFPFLEVGKDSVKCDVIDLNTMEFKQVDFYILSRTMKGIQAFKDEFIAKGEEEQSIFISDLNTKIDQIKQVTDKISSDIKDGKIGGFKFVQVMSESDIPSPPEANTAYYKVGEVSYFDKVVN